MIILAVCWFMTNLGTASTVFICTAAPIFGMANSFKFITSEWSTDIQISKCQSANLISLGRARRSKVKIQCYFWRFGCTKLPLLWFMNLFFPITTWRLSILLISRSYFLWVSLFIVTRSVSLPNLVSFFRVYQFAFIHLHPQQWRSDWSGCQGVEISSCWIIWS